MSYLVLARKYRPQTFDEIVGQEHVTRTMANAFARGRVHHAFLFCGARGVGKTTAARVLAKALCCDSGATAQPCGACDACRTITAGTAVDYFEIDGASNNSVDNIRELRDGIRYQPAQLRRKIYVIDEVHMLSTAAFNALLKTLEEPPPHVTFVFATTEVHKIPITILSRCQRYDFKLVPAARLAAHLTTVFQKESIAADSGAVHLIAREAGGSVRDALSLADQVIAYAGGDPITEAKVADVLGVADRALLRDLADAVLSGNGRTALLCVDAAVERGVDLGHLARAFLTTLRDLTVIAEIGDVTGLVDATPDELQTLRNQAKRVAKLQLHALFERFVRACEELGQSATPRLILDIALLDMAGSEPLQPMGELVDRLGRLEERLRTGTSTRAAARVPAPVAVAAPASGSLAAWEEVVVAFEEKHLVLAGLYSNAKFLGWSSQAIDLGYSSSLFERAKDPDNLGRLKRFLAERTGSPLDVRVKTIQGVSVGASVSELEQERRVKERDKREAEVLTHPATQVAIETFGATVKEIKLDG